MSCWHRRPLAYANGKKTVTASRLKTSADVLAKSFQRIEVIIRVLMGAAKAG